MRRAILSTDNNVGYLARMYMIDELPQGPQGAQGPQGDGDTSIIRVFSGDMLNPGDKAQHTLFTQMSHASTVVTLTVLAHDLNSNTTYFYHQSTSYWTRNWSNAPTRQDLGTPITSVNGDPANFLFEHTNEENDIVVKLTQNTAFATNVKYKIIAKMLAVRWL